MIKLTNVSKDYKTKAGWRRVLKDINLVINPGERVGILGRNGAGKSTLIRLISGAEDALNPVPEPTALALVRHDKPATERRA